ncbi:methyltransferase [Flavobacterium noncentrifugens]|nr:class I SAM-dependent methyltransferase [Flavobacterium noncentrifugens]GEP49997.1 methyltransferase [Flavobacterium noncentrifugens]
MDMHDKEFYLKVKDYSVSKETFELYHNKTLDLLMTHPKPDPENLSRYYESDDYISHTDGKRSLFEKAYHIVKNIALKKKVCMINFQQIGKGRLLDIGAGTGDFLLAAKENGWATVGYEPSDKARNIAMSKGVSFTDRTEKLPNYSLDVITMWHVLEHVSNVEAQISELKRLLKPNGTIFIAVPNFKSYDAQHYGEFWAAYDVPRHLYHFSKTAIKLLFQKEELDLIKIIPMKFDSFYVSLLSEKYKTGTMNYFKAFITGLKSNAKGNRSKEYSSHIYILKNTKTDINSLESLF